MSHAHPKSLYQNDAAIRQNDFITLYVHMQMILLINKSADWQPNYHKTCNITFPQINE